MAQISSRMFGGRSADKPKLASGPGPAYRVGAATASALPVVLLLVAAGALAAPDPVQWWVRVLGAVCGLLGAYLAGRLGYGAPGSESLLAHELTKAEARDRDLTRILVGLALADVRAPGGGDREGPKPQPGEPVPAPVVHGGGRPGAPAGTVPFRPPGRPAESLDGED